MCLEGTFNLTAQCNLLNVSYFLAVPAIAVKIEVATGIDFAVSIAADVSGIPYIFASDYGGL